MLDNFAFESSLPTKHLLWLIPLSHPLALHWLVSWLPNPLFCYFLLPSLSQQETQIYLFLSYKVFASSLLFSCPHPNST